MLRTCFSKCVHVTEGVGRCNIPILKAPSLCRCVAIYGRWLYSNDKNSVQSSMCSCTGKRFFLHFRLCGANKCHLKTKRKPLRERSNMVGPPNDRWKYQQKQVDSALAHSPTLLHSSSCLAPALHHGHERYRTVHG